MRCEEILNHAKPLCQVCFVFNNSQFTIHCSLVRQMFCIDLLGRHVGGGHGAAKPHGISSSLRVKLPEGCSVTLAYRTTRPTSAHSQCFFPSLRSTFTCSLYSLKQGVYFHTSVSTCGSLPLSPPVSFFCNFLKPNFASSFAKAAFLAGFHCINPRCFLLSVLLFALL